MKTALQLSVSALALAGLLATAASHATSLAELPLKASVLAKPNLILGMDDSGSMDSEVVLDTADGVFWWNFDTGLGWDANGVLYRHVNLGEYWSSTWRRYFYLFPNGNGGGLNIKSEATFGDWSLPPTSQFAWARSPNYNPQYYDPSVTYGPWATANGYAAFPNATPSAARGHPVNGGAGNVVDLTNTRAASQLTSRYFHFVRGMTLPAGSTASVCDANIQNCGAWNALAADGPAQNIKVTKVAMAYWPATYWIKATAAWDCNLGVAAALSVGVRDCASAPDGTKLRRIEIKPANLSYPSGRSYAAELQNFANWFQYHRKRRLSANAAIGEVLESMRGLNMGVIRMNALPANASRIAMYDLDNTNAASNGKAVLQFLYPLDTDVGTPTRQTLNRIGYEFTQAAGPIKYACQRNAALILTDGYASSGGVAPPGYASATYGSGAPYATTFANTLADIALSYYTNVMGGGGFATGRVPPGTVDTNTDLHMNTYALTLGAVGDIFKGEATPNPVANVWANPNTDFNPSAVDDLWHATINGRGKMYLATSSSETSVKLQSAFNDILDQAGAQGGVAVSAVNLDKSDGKAYLGSYNPRGWAGDLEARSIDKATADISAVVTWSAAAKLQAADWTKRLIFTSLGNAANAGIDFSAANTPAGINPDVSAYTKDQIVDFLRGNRGDEGTLLRSRSSLLGPVVNAEPVLAREEGMVYVASGEGMLHALDTVTGVEQWAFVPPDQFTTMGASAVRGWVYNTLLDATPSYIRLKDNTRLLVGGLGAAGRSYYALDVSSPKSANLAAAAAQFKWIFPLTGDAATRAKMGYTVGKPTYARTAAGEDIVLVTSGYDNGQVIGDRKGRVWVLDAKTGVAKGNFVTTEIVPVGSESGLAHVAAFREADGSVRYAYGGDLRGNLWRFDLNKIVGNPADVAADQVAVLKDGAGNMQPVTSMPELVTQSAKRVIMLGTGRLLDIGDFGSGLRQSFYAIVDGATLANARTSLTVRTFTRGATPELSGNAVDWGTGRGWYFDLPAGEQVNTDPTVAYGAIVFVSNKAGSSDCSQQSWFYLLNATTGLQISNLIPASQLLSNTATSSRPVVVRDTTGQLHALTQQSDRNNKQTPLPLGESITPAKNAWREIRR